MKSLEEKLAQANAEILHTAFFLRQFFAHALLSERLEQALSSEKKYIF